MSPNSSYLRDLLQEVSKTHHGAFPDNSVNYLSRFDTVAEYLNSKIHEEVEKAALLRDALELKNYIQNKEKDSTIEEPQIYYLTNHGPKHIQTVIDFAGHIVKSTRTYLTPYEVYILLLAIHFHDVGNLYGRKGHEKNIRLVLNSEKVAPLIGNNQAEIRTINRIAAAHGGTVDGKNQDTIDALQEYEDISRCRVRLKLLAAILRFADELSDEPSRSSNALDIDDLGASEVYHKYAASIRTIDIEDDRITLEIDLSKDDVIRKFRKKSEQVYIIEEIFARTVKMHHERSYCMEFISTPINAKFPHIDIEKIYTSSIRPIKSIKVKINIYDDLQMDDYPVETIEYSLKKQGYPAYEGKDIYRLCPTINQNFARDHPGCEELNGETLRNLFSDKEI